MIAFSITMGIVLFLCFVLVVAMNYKRFTCTHKGMVTVKDMITPSTVTRFVEATGKAVAGEEENGAMSPNEMWLYKEEVAQKHILVLLCPDCGKIKKIVTEF